MDARPIGVFDSGLGGLTVVAELKKLLPNENIIYLGDTARVPYGTRSKRTVTRFSLQDVNFLINNKVKCIIVACNTSSALAGNTLKRRISLPVFEVLSPGVKAAARLTKNCKIGVIGTRATITSRAHEKKITRINVGIKVIARHCPLFVPFIEEGEIRGKLISDLADKYLMSIKRSKIDVLILGCTHYPIIKSIIGKKIGPKVALVNPGEEVAKEVSKYLEDNKLLAPENKRSKNVYYVTDLTDRFTKVAEMFLGKPLDGKILRVNLS